MTTGRPTLEDLGALVRRAREATGMGRRKIAALGVGPSSPETWLNIERGHQVQTLTYAGVEKALGWPDGSITTYLDGGPEPAAPGDPEPDLPPRIDVASHDELLDELRRRHLADRAELARRLSPVLAEYETPASAAGRGNILGARVVNDDRGTDDAAGGR